MDILDILYQREFKNINFNVRKVQINDKKLLLLGPRGAGKSSLIFDYLSQRKKGSFLYIDLNDFRLTDINISHDLPIFLKKHHISLLVLEHFSFSFELPVCLETIITTDEKSKINGFTTAELFPLDFEEFLSFEKRELNIEATFNSYASSGTFPAMQTGLKNDYTKNLQQYIKEIYTQDKIDMTMLKILSSHQARVVSINKLFILLKKNHKVSKDRFYNFTKKLQKKYILFLVEKFDGSKNTKKMYLIDFTIRGVLNFDKDFIKRFENIVFLELVKRNKNIFYTDSIEFYLPNEKKAILTISFLPIDMIKNKIQRLETHFIKYDINTVQIITMGESAEFNQNGITYEILPFWNFATSL